MSTRNMVTPLDNKRTINSIIEICSTPCTKPDMKLLNVAPRLSICAMCLLYVGCANVVNVVIEDDRAPSAVLRANKEFGPRFSINTELTHTEGSDRQELSAGQELDLGNRNIFGPGFLDNDFELDTAAVVADFKVLDYNKLKLHLGPGLRYSRINLDINGNKGDRLAIAENELGILFGVRLIVPFTERLSGEIHFAASHTIDFIDGVLLEDGSVELNYRLAKRLNMFGGWYSSKYENYEDSSGINIDTSGLRYGLQFDF